MKLFYILLLLVFNLFAGEAVPVDEKPQVMLKAISEDAIRIGTGNDKTVYMFVDPMCKFSKRLMKIINKNKMLQLTNSYYIFLYKLPKLNSEKLIQYIYQADDKKTTLLDVMIDEEIIDFDDFKATQKTLKAIQTVADAAKKLDITIRPYIISFEKDSKFCMVSEGEASCIEEFED